MKKRKIKIKAILAIIIIIIQFVIICLLLSNSEEESTTITTVVEKKVSTQTIENTLTGSGEVSTSNSEKLSLTAGKYFKTMCVEENDEVKAGENILEYTNGTYLVAPYDCLISSYSVPETGNICTTSHQIEIENLDTLIISLSVDETEITKLEKNQEVEITLNAFEDKTYQGTITKINELGTYSSSGSVYTVTITFENEDNNIKLGMSASCSIVLEKAENVIAVPIEAIQTKQDEKYVIIVNGNGETTEQTVTTGISNDEYVQIEEGLTGSETIQMIQSTTTSNKTSNNSSNSEMTRENGGFQMQDMGQGRPGEM